MLRKTLLASAALPLIGFAHAASAQVEITDARTDPIFTDTIDSGNPGDIIIRSGGSVIVEASGAVITIDSNNSVTNEGAIGAIDVNNVTGVLLTGGTNGELINVGNISLSEDFTQTDDDGDGDLDGPKASGTGRTGILVEGPAAFTGNITSRPNATIIIDGNDSAGIRILSGLNGNLTSDGSITVTGNNSYGVQIASIVNGDINIGGDLTTDGENSVALSVTSDVNGAITNTGRIGSTGFNNTTRLDNAEARAKLDADDLLRGGSAVSITANVTGGFNNGTAVDEDLGIVTRVGQISVQGSAPAVIVAAGNTGGDLVLGAVGLAEDNRNFGFVNEGVIAADGINDGFAATAVRIQGAEVGGVMQRAIIENGLRNTSTITTDSFDAAGRAVWIGDGAVAETISNSGRIRSTVTSQFGEQSNAIIIDAGGEVHTLINTGILESNFTGSGASARAITFNDQSGMVDLIENEGFISARFTEILIDGQASTADDDLRRAVAIDVSNNTSGVTIRQNQSTAFVDTTPAITGDILLGDGNDIVELNAGTMTGDILFGDGEDVLRIDGGAQMSGAVFDSDGLLTLDVNNGTVALGADTAVNISSATFGADALMQMTLMQTDTGISGATFNASGAVTFQDGATIAPILTNLVGDQASFNFLQSNTLSIASTLDAMLATDQLPILYDVSLRQGLDGTSLFVDLQRRTAADLGLSANQAAAFDPWFNALSASDDSGLETGFVQITDRDEFTAAFDQLLPEYGAASLQFTLANTDGTTGAIATRLDNVRRGYGPQGGLWAQEIGYYMNRNSSSTAQPYRGFGLGIAVGIDKPMGPFDAVGIAISGFSNEISQRIGFDKPLSSKSIQIGVYSGGKRGGFNFENHAAIGFDDFDSERELNFGTVSRSATGDWSGYHIAGSSRMSYDITAGKWFVRPSLSVDYLSLREGSYTETGGGAGFDLGVDSRTSKTFSGTGSVTIGRKFGRKNGSWWSPRLRVGIRSDFNGDAANTVARFNGFSEEFTLTPEQLPDTAVLLGFSFAAGSRFTSFGFDYDADIRDGFVRHTGRLVIRFIF